MGQAQHALVEVGGAYGKMLDIFANFPERNAHSALVFGVSHLRPSGATKAYGYPEAGFSLSFHDLGNRDVLGYGVGLQYEMTFHQRLTDRLEFTQRFKSGGIYLNRPYDPVTNRENIVNGSHLAFLVGINAGLRYALTEQHLLRLDGTFWHSSNGHTALPNVGMNSPLVQLSYQYRFDQAAQRDSAQFEAPFLQHKRSWSWSLVGGFGLNEAGGTIRPTSAPLYAKYRLGTGIGVRVRDIHRWTVTLEGYYDGANRVWNESQEWADDRMVLRSSVLMLLVGHEFIYNRFGMVINGGLNLYNPTLQQIEYGQDKTSFFNQVKVYMPGRFAVRYYFSHPWKHASSGFVQVGIKSHFGQADYLDFGIGYLIGTRKD